MVLKRRQGFAAMAGFEDGITLCRRMRQARLPDSVFVFDDEHGFGSAGRCKLRRFRGFGDRAIDFRQINAKCGSQAGLAPNRHVTAALLDDPKDRSQPQTRSSAYSFGGEKRLEHPGFGLFVHAAAGVADRQNDVRPTSYRDEPGCNRGPVRRLPFRSRACRLAAWRLGR